MPQELMVILLLGLIILVYLPVHLQWRKVRRLADADLRRLNYEEWKRQVRANARAKLAGRVIWGIFVLSGPFFNFSAFVGAGFNWLTLFMILVGGALIMSGILGFQRAEIQFAGSKN